MGYGFVGYIDLAPDPLSGARACRADCVRQGLADAPDARGHERQASEPPQA